MTDRRPGLRDRLGGSGRHHADALLSPLPPGLPPELARSKALRQHGNVVKAWKALRAELVRLQAEAEAVERSSGVRRGGRPVIGAIDAKFVSRR